ncbi:MAG TPA: hypothetical protein VN764_08755 [Polyangiaceae bacterium]|nr:hypothetical protein [Polyangiaceae bacterium]
MSALWMMPMALALLTECAAEPPPPAETPEPAPAPAPAAPEPAPTAEPEAQAPAKPAAPPPEPEPTGPTRPATEILLDSDADFLLDDGASSLKEAARQKCEGEAPEGSDPGVIQTCVQKERDQFSGDVITFQQTPNGIRLTIYRRRGSRLDEVYAAPVELKEQSPTTVLVKLKGFKGARPFLPGVKEFSLEVPDNYSLVIEDPNMGKLVYRVKVGLVTR